MIWVREAASASLMSIVKKIEEVIHMLKGIGVSDGIGIGRVMILAEQSLDYTPKEITDIDAELARYREAVDKFCDNTVEQANAIRQSTGDKEAEILEGHIAIIRDPFMGGEIENLIKANQCAEAAVDQICKMFIDMFSATGDDLTMQRAADVRDIRDGILGILLGVQEVKISDAPAGTVLVVKELTPSMTAGIKKENIVGIIAETGSQTSHSAILARALEIPAALSVANATTAISSQEIVIVDGFKGNVLVAPDPQKIEEFTAKRTAYLREKRELETLRGKVTADADGNEYELFCNIGTPKDATKAMDADGEGVGLFRTEFLFMDRNQLPTEDVQAGVSDHEGQARYHPHTGHRRRQGDPVSRSRQRRESLHGLPCYPLLPQEPRHVQVANQGDSPRQRLWRYSHHVPAHHSG